MLKKINKHDIIKNIKIKEAMKMDTIKVKLKNGEYGYVGFEKGFISIKGQTFWIRQKIARMIKVCVRENVPVNYIIRTIGGLKYDPIFSCMIEETVSSHFHNCK